MTTNVHELSLESIPQLGDGSVAIAWQQGLQRVLYDCCTDRPGVDKPRKLMLEMSAVPVMDERGIADGIAVTFRVKDDLPQRQSRDFELAVRQVKGKHTAVFSDVSADGTPTLFDDVAD